MARNTKTQSRNSKTSIQQKTPSKEAQRQPQPQPQPQPQANPGSFGEAVKSGIGIGVGIEAVKGAMGMFNKNKNDDNNNFNSFPECKIEHQEFQKCLSKNPDYCFEYYKKLTNCMIYKTDLNITQ